MERRTDIYISTLRRHIEAMGGQLEVMARFSTFVLSMFGLDGTIHRFRIELHDITIDVCITARAMRKTTT